MSEHESLIAAGQQQDVEVHTLRSFANKFLGTRLYVNERENAPFGSAVDGDGRIDQTSYTPIHYVDKIGKKYSLDDVCNCLKNGDTIILVGEFGTGKSRCLMEVFRKIATKSNPFAPIAINLRDNWGYKKLGHIVRTHLENLGLSDYSDSTIRSLLRGHHIILLDGIDEIGSQSWSGDPMHLTEIRKKSLEGVRVRPEGLSRIT